MLDHVLIRVADRAATERFLDTVLEPLAVVRFQPKSGITRWENLGVVEADAEHPVTSGLHAGLVAPSRDLVDAFWRAGTEAGYVSAGAPGPRPEYGDDYYGAFLLDPDGNSIEAVHDSRLADKGVIDHLWIRVAELRTSRDFYAAIAPFTGFRLEVDTAQRAGFRGDGDTFSILPGPPTRDLHVAFAAPDQQTVRDFHATATAAGYADNGAPGPRPQYGEGYFGAFVWDPDGNNVEVVYRGGGR